MTHFFAVRRPRGAEYDDAGEQRLRRQRCRPAVIPRAAFALGTDRRFAITGVCATDSQLVGLGRLLGARCGRALNYRAPPRRRRGQRRRRRQDSRGLFAFRLVPRPDPTYLFRPDHLSLLTPRSVVVPDEFFELSEADAMHQMTAQKRHTSSLVDRPLLTSTSRRQLEQARQNERPTVRARIHVIPYSHGPRQTRRSYAFGSPTGIRFRLRFDLPIWFRSSMPWSVLSCGSQRNSFSVRAISIEGRAPHLMNQSRLLPRPSSRRPPCPSIRQASSHFPSFTS